jgi:hypothetical protein
MTSRRTGATFANLLDSLLLLGLEFPFMLSIGAPLFPIPLLIIGVVLLLDTALCYFGGNSGFFVGALLSFLGGLPLFLFPGLLLTPSMTLVAIVSVATVVLDILALGSRTRLAEQSHPLNTPIFG